MIRKLVSLAALAAVAAPAALAQDAATLTGHWTGAVVEDGSIPIYTLSVHLGLDAGGRLVGLVEYDAFPCSGVWTNARYAANVWRLDETITANWGNCATLVDIELASKGEEMQVRLSPVGADRAWSTGVLNRRQ